MTVREKYKYIFSLQILWNSFYIHFIVLSEKVSSHYLNISPPVEAACGMEKRTKLPQLFLIRKPCFNLLITPTSWKQYYLPATAL